MSDKSMKAEEAVEDGGKKKKGGKLPIILALVLLLGGGGFFAMKMKAKGAAKEPEIKLGEIVPIPEILVNLQGGETYARAEIFVQLKEGYKKEEFDRLLQTVREAAQLVINSHTESEVATYDGKMALKKELAEAINAVLAEGDKEHQSEPAGPEKKNQEGGSKVQESHADPKKAEEKKKKKGHESWDSETGPVLKVILASFATQ
ncbi:MAG: flagellar basal body-associated FliL family protein [Armatimonadetes bacterium]|nr:flagellar basal body-associated FliL family protein [Armatimonadota bacterium]